MAAVSMHHRPNLHVLDVLVERHEVLSVVLGEKAAKLGELILHVFVLNHPNLEVLAEVFPWEQRNQAVRMCGGDGVRET